MFKCLRDGIASILKGRGIQIENRQGSRGSQPAGGAAKQFNIKSEGMTRNDFRSREVLQRCAWVRIRPA
jgi:hypothetical protein